MKNVMLAIYPAFSKERRGEQRWNSCLRLLFQPAALCPCWPARGRLKKQTTLIEKMVNPLKKSPSDPASGHATDSRPLYRRNGSIAYFFILLVNIPPGALVFITVRNILWSFPAWVIKAPDKLTPANQKSQKSELHQSPIVHQALLSGICASLLQNSGDRNDPSGRLKYEDFWQFPSSFH